MAAPAHAPVFAPTPKDEFHKKVTEKDLAWKLDDHPDWFTSSSFITVGKVRNTLTSFVDICASNSWYCRGAEWCHNVDVTHISRSFFFLY